MSVPTNKNLSTEIVPHLSSALRDLHLGKIFCRLLFKNVLQLVGFAIIIQSWKIIVVQVYMDIFNDIIFSQYLTTKQTLTFGYIKWTPDVAFTGSFPDIMFGQYFKRGKGQKNCHQKLRMALLLPVFDRQYRPWCHVRFLKNERLECEIKVPLGYFS